MRILRERRAHRAVAERELQRRFRHARFMQKRYRRDGDQRRFLGGLGDDAIARRQRRRDLTGEDGDREVPRADADDEPERDMRRGVEAARDLGAVIAQEIDGFAHVAQRIGERLARLAHDEAGELARPRLIEIGGARENGAAVRGGHVAPFEMAMRDAGADRLGLRAAEVDHGADGVAGIGGVADKARARQGLRRRSRSRHALAQRG